MTSARNVALVGLGQMGRGVAVNLLKKDFTVTGADVNPDAITWLNSQGGRGVSSAAEAAKSCDVMILFVVNDAQTEQVIFGDDGVLQALRPGAILVTCSTQPPAYVRELGRRLAEHGVALVDAPVTGGKAGAEAGTLSIMAAGKGEHIAIVRPVLEAFSRRIFVLGEEPGMGSEMKVINQLMCGVHIVAAAEAIALARKSGLPAEMALEILRSGAASSWMLGDRGPRMAAEAYDDVTSAVDIFVKDMNLVMAAASSQNFDSPLAAVACEQFRRASANGWGRLDDSAVIKNYEAG